jgi:hypothetical protein
MSEMITDFAIRIADGVGIALMRQGYRARVGRELD